MKKQKLLFLILTFFITSLLVFSASIKVISPNGGENWQKGSTYNITWNSSGVSGNVIIKLLKGGTMLGSIAWNIPNTGNYSWAINKIRETSIQPGSDYRVLIRSFDDHSIEDESDSNFTIKEDPRTKMFRMKRADIKRPDLVVDKVSDCFIYMGGISFNLWIKNIGDRDIDGAEDKFRIALSLTGSRGECKAYTKWITSTNSIKMEQSVPYRVVFNSMRAGVCVFVDDDKDVFEKDEKNNFKKLWLENCN